MRPSSPSGPAGDNRRHRRRRELTMSVRTMGQCEYCHLGMSLAAIRCSETQEHATRSEAALPRHRQPTAERGERPVRRASMAARDGVLRSAHPDRLGEPEATRHHQRKGLPSGRTRTGRQHLGRAGRDRAADHRVGAAERDPRPRRSVTSERGQTFRVPWYSVSWSSPCFPWRGWRWREPGARCRRRGWCRPISSSAQAWRSPCRRRRTSIRPPAEATPNACVPPASGACCWSIPGHGSSGRWWSARWRSR